MKPFVKLECDIVDRFDDDMQLLLYMKLLCLMDREGRIRMDYDAIAARVRWPFERVLHTMQKLMRPNPRSRCQRYAGACVVLLDPQQPKAGFLIPAAVRHRKRNAKTEARLIQQRNWARKKREARRQASTPRRQASTPRRLPPPSKSTSVDTASTSVDTMSTAIESTEREDKSTLSQTLSQSEQNGDALAFGTESFTDWDDERIKAFFARYGPGRLPAVHELPEQVKEDIVTMVVQVRQKKNGGAR